MEGDQHQHPYLPFSIQDSKKYDSNRKIRIIKKIRLQQEDQNNKIQQIHILLVMKEQPNRSYRQSQQLRRDMRQLIISLNRNNLQNQRQNIQRLLQLFPSLFQNIQAYNQSDRPILITSILCDNFRESNHQITLPEEFLPLLLNIIETTPINQIHFRILKTISYLVRDCEEIKNQITLRVNFFAGQLQKHLFDPLKCSQLLHFILTLLDQCKNKQVFICFARPLLQTFQTQSLRNLSISCLAQIFVANLSTMKTIILDNRIVQSCCLQILNHQPFKIWVDRGYVFHILQFIENCLTEFEPSTFWDIILPFILLLNALNFDFGISNAIYLPYKLERKSLNIIKSSIQNPDKFSMFMNHQLIEVLFLRLKSIDISKNDNEESFDLLIKIFKPFKENLQVKDAIRIRRKQLPGKDDDEITDANESEMNSE